MAIVSHRYFFLLVSVSFLFVFGCQPPASTPSNDEAGFVSLFNGQDLSEWEDSVSVWRVKDGVIIGENNEELGETPSWLYTKKSYRDFELRLDVKLTGHPFKNSGVWYRVEPFPFSYSFWGSEEDEEDESEEAESFMAATGYELDLFIVDEEGEPYLNFWGALHDSYRRPKFGQKPDLKDIERVMNKDDWNQLVIRCKGNHLQHWVNGFQVANYIDKDPTAPLAGKIGFQIYHGYQTKVEFNNIRIKLLN